MRGRNEDQLLPLIEFAAARNLLLRFIELMPVSTTEVLNENNFIFVMEAKALGRVGLRLSDSGDGSFERMVQPFTIRFRDARSA